MAENKRHKGHRQRMRERVQSYGLDSLAEHEALEYVLYLTNAQKDTNGIAHARLLAQKGCRVFVPGGLLRPQTEAIIGAAALTAIQQYNFTKACLLYTSPSPRDRG